MIDLVTLYCATCRKPFRMPRSQLEAYERQGRSPKYCKRTCQPKPATRPKRHHRTGA